MENIRTEVVDNCTIMRLSGQFTGGEETDDLVTAFEQAALTTANPKLIVDFENTTYLSSIVIGLLVRTHAKFSEKDGTLLFCSLNTTLRSVLKMTKVDTVLNITNTLDEAVTKMNK